jgi:hypothetical protein
MNISAYAAAPFNPEGPIVPKPFDPFNPEGPIVFADHKLEIRWEADCTPEHLALLDAVCDDTCPDRIAATQRLYAADRRPDRAIGSTQAGAAP